jgi:hypothetical protein
MGPEKKSLKEEAGAPGEQATRFFYRRTSHNQIDYKVIVEAKIMNQTFTDIAHKILTNNWVILSGGLFLAILVIGSAN